MFFKLELIFTYKRFKSSLLDSNKVLGKLKLIKMLTFTQVIKCKIPGKVVRGNVGSSWLSAQSISPPETILPYPRWR